VLSWLRAVVLLVGASTGSTGGPTEARRYRIPGHGVLVLTVPTSWQEEVRQPRDGLPPTITFRPEVGDEFTVLVTALWSPTREPGYNSVEKIRRMVETGGQHILPRAVEPQLELQEIRGASGGGYFYACTDKSLVDTVWTPGEYQYAHQGRLGVGDLLLAFTLLSDAKESEPVREVFTMLRGATQRTLVYTWPLWPSNIV
jgi:hypothetical protein